MSGGSDCTSTDLIQWLEYDVKVRESPERLFPFDQVRFSMLATSDAQKQSRELQGTPTRESRWTRAEDCRTGKKENGSMPGEKKKITVLCGLLLEFFDAVPVDCMVA